MNDGNVVSPDRGLMLKRLLADGRYRPSTRPVRVVGWDAGRLCGLDVTVVYYATMDGSGGFRTYPEPWDVYQRRLTSPDPFTVDPYAALRGML
ncbi:hypothetical protein [Bifidobacterium felsineum]|uniref:hypothetical protein n=1 Tax=Bifidobacterium felsineum TaxID=2045440 RepID=UPI001BDC305C|nr:hypothetical protein [Bifidobacterium felsineum]MBT1164968.1 hypothetical protein [Bifidobacterium felsineum]